MELDSDSASDESPASLIIAGVVLLAGPCLVRVFVFEATSPDKQLLLYMGAGVSAVIGSAVAATIADRRRLTIGLSHLMLGAGAGVVAVALCVATLAGFELVTPKAPRLAPGSPDVSGTEMRRAAFRAIRKGQLQNDPELIEQGKMMQAQAQAQDAQRYILGSKTLTTIWNAGPGLVLGTDQAAQNAREFALQHLPDAATIVSIDPPETKRRPGAINETNFIDTAEGVIGEFVGAGIFASIWGAAILVCGVRARRSSG